MHNIKFIRSNPESFDAAMTRRGLGPLSEEILARDSQKRQGQTNLQELQAQANEWAKKIGTLKAAGQDASQAIAKSKELKLLVAAAKDSSKQQSNDQTNALVDDLLVTLPNILDDDVPDGETEEDNVEVRRVGELPIFDFHPKEHFELGEALGLMDFETATAMSGSRFVILKGNLAKLERAIAHMVLDIQTTENGYNECSVPLLVRDHAMFGSGQLPKFAEDSFETTNGYRLIPTSEVPLVNTVREQILEHDQLPIRITAQTPCFRSEAGAAGRDTRGMIRMHQFTKVELVSITDEDSSAQELERMTACAEEILKRLELPYRVVLLCSADTGLEPAKHTI